MRKPDGPLQRAALALSAVAFLGFGAAFLIAPEDMAAHVDLRADTPVARADLRAVYGGLELGAGVFLATCLRSAVRTGLVAALILLACMAGARGLGFALDGPQSAISWALWSSELAGVAFVGLALARGGARRGPPT